MMDRVRRASKSVLLLGMSLSLASCQANGKTKLVDVTLPETWLLPDEVEKGRQLTLATNTSIHFETPKGCILPFSGNRKDVLGSDAIPRDQLELTALISSAEIGSYQRVDPLSNMKASLSYLRGRYLNGDGTSLVPSIMPVSLSCLAAQGVNVGGPDHRKEIFFVHLNYLQKPSYRSKRQSYTLRHNGTHYCEIDLSITDRIINRVDVSVLNIPNDVPRYRDFMAMDCIMRGIFAGVGFTGILRFSIDELYPAELLKEPALSRGLYTAHLMNGFNKYQEGIIFGGRSQ